VLDAQPDFTQTIHDVGHLVDGEPVHLKRLARGDVGDAARVIAVMPAMMRSARLSPSRRAA
jgi:hypothetical protein